MPCPACFDDADPHVSAWACVTSGTGPTNTTQTAAHTRTGPRAPLPSLLKLIRQLTASGLCCCRVWSAIAEKQKQRVQMSCRERKRRWRRVMMSDACAQQERQWNGQGRPVDGRQLSWREARFRQQKRIRFRLHHGRRYHDSEWPRSLIPPLWPGVLLFGRLCS